MAAPATIKFIHIERHNNPLSGAQNAEVEFQSASYALPMRADRGTAIPTSHDAVHSPQLLHRILALSFMDAERLIAA